MITLYGIPNCGSVRKGLDWFKTHNVEVVFHNFRKEGLSPEMLDTWLKTVSADTLLNRKGQIWRKLPEEVRANTQDNPEQMRALMLENPSIIKRPVVVFPNGTITVGLSEDLWTTLIG